MRVRAALAANVLSLAVSLNSPAGAAPENEGTIEVTREGDMEKGSVALGGALVSAWAPAVAPGSEAALWLLVRTVREADGERTLLKLTLEPEPRLVRAVTGLGGWMDTLAAADLGAGPELLAAGEGRLEALGVRLSQTASESGEAPVSVPIARPLLKQAGLSFGELESGRLRHGVERRFVAAEPGRIRVWESDGAGRLRPPVSISIPFSVTRSTVGLRRTNAPILAPLSSSSVSAGGALPGDLLFVGPEDLGHLRLRGEWIDLAHPEAARTELWAALPGPERVAQSWPARIGSTPVLIVRTQAADEMNLFERQRLRVLPLVEDRTRAGAAAALAVELDSKRWHDTEVALDDIDGDGLDDLLAVFPEGLSGSDLIAQWWRGLGAGRFEPKARRSDIKDGGAAWIVVAANGSRSKPSILLLREGNLELRPFAGTGRKALEETSFSVAVQPKGESDPEPEPTVTVGSGSEAVEVRNEPAEPELLGAVEIDGRPGLEGLLLIPEGKSGDRLLVVRHRANSPR